MLSQQRSQFHPALNTCNATSLANAEHGGNLLVTEPFTSCSRTPCDSRWAIAHGPLEIETRDWCPCVATGSVHPSSSKPSVTAFIRDGGCGRSRGSDAAPGDTPVPRAASPRKLSSFGEPEEDLLQEILAFLRDPDIRQASCRREGNAGDTALERVAISSPAARDQLASGLLTLTALDGLDPWPCLSYLIQKGRATQD